MAQWYRQTAGAVQKELNTDAAQGLSSAEAAARLQQVGPNELVERGGRTPWHILCSTLSNSGRVTHGIDQTSPNRGRE